MIAGLLSLWFLVTAALSYILFIQERKLISETAPLYRDEVVLGLLSIARLMWLVSSVVIGFYNWKLLVSLYVVAFLLMHLLLANLVEKFLLFPFMNLVVLCLQKAGRGKQGRQPPTDGEGE
jgi:hypothetical protein